MPLQMVRGAAGRHEGVVVAEGALRAGDPRRLGGYRIERRLGEGGQGVVYLGVSETGRKVAIKVVRRPLVSGDASAFIREITAARQVAEFCTAVVLDTALDHDPPYIVSEYVDGPTLQQVIAIEGVRTGVALQRLAVATITALAAIHRAGVVHRDFKPSNVLLAPDGPRVIDFGIARIVDMTTTTGTTAGSPPYMAPEHFTGARIGPEADVFAWGATMVFAATGRPPFGDDNLAAVAYRILNAEPDLSALPDLLRDVVRRCLAKDPAQRPTANDVLLRLLHRSDPSPADALEQGGAVAGGAKAPVLGDEPATRPAVPRRRLLAGAGGAAAVLVASGAAALGDRIWADDTDGAGAAAGPRTPRPTGTTAAPSPTPSPLPDGSFALVRALEAALADAPAADFTFTGDLAHLGMRVSAKGRLFYDGSRLRDTAYDMELRSNAAGGISGRVVIVDGKGYAPNRQAAGFDVRPEAKNPPEYAWPVLMVFALTSIQSIIALLSTAPSFKRTGRSYTGSGQETALAGRHVGDYLYDRIKVDGTVSYTLTVDERARPTHLRVTVRAPVKGSTVESHFTTRYTGWRKGPRISPPR